ncbi:hypothetical protein GH714_000032 [Hevea brasiliensis]|uniref:Tudor domain-containing protein n=1 Tax=Hevea brasiliensis TaxID=3981 RepID=A0A6A6NA82_HEVBR|nr:hypothetical protein GH714_000032 [Hevea brasiliensis]
MEVTRDIGRSLAALSLANTEVLAGIQNEMQRVELEASISQLQIVDKLNQGLHNQKLNQTFANGMLEEIAWAVGVPVEPSEISKELARMLFKIIISSSGTIWDNGFCSATSSVAVWDLFSIVAVNFDMTFDYKLECLLINVEQAPSRSMQDALLSPMKALISNTLLRNSDTDVKVSVASCISEITRITAPDAPYNDDHMKEIFQLTIAAFEKLSHVSSRFYTKAVSILDTVAKVRSCLVMLDLELDELIIKMFQHFLKIIRFNHPHAVFVAMETIMTLIIDESEDISVGLLTPLLASIRKENQSVSPIAWKLGEKVITNCAAKLKPYLKELVQSIGIALDEYAPIVASICQDETLTLKCDHVNASGDHLVTKGLSPIAASPGEGFQAMDAIPKLTTNGNTSTRNADNVNNISAKVLEHCSLIQHCESNDAQGDAEPEVKLEKERRTVPRKRGRKPNSLMNPEEGYDHSWISSGRKTAKLRRKPRDKGVDLRSEITVPKKVSLSSAHVRELTGLRPETGSVIGASSSPSRDQSLNGGSHPKRGRPKKNASSTNQGADPSSLKLLKGEVLNTANEEITPAEDEVSLRKQYARRSNSEVKQQKCSSKIGLDAKTTEEASLPSAYTLSDEKAGFLNEHEEKPSQSTKIRVRNIRRESSLFQTDIRKRSSVSGVSDVASNIKKTKSSRDGSYGEETPKANRKRKRTPRKEVPPDLGEQLVGSRIKVWWPRDKMFYEGVLDSYDPIKKKHKVLYADGDEEILNLEGNGGNLLEMIFCLVKPGKQKGKLISESTKQLKVDFKRKKARKSKGAAAQDEPIVANKVMDDTSRPDNGSEGDSKESTDKLKIKTLRIGINSKQKTPETASPSSDENGEGGNEFCVTARPRGTLLNNLVKNEQRSEVVSLDSAETS